MARTGMLTLGAALVGLATLATAGRGETTPAPATPPGAVAPAPAAAELPAGPAPAPAAPVPDQPAVPAARGSGAAPTRVALFLPFHAAGLRPGVTVSERATGTCFAGSLASSGRPDAWRCNSGDRIYDPCFEGTQDERTVLLCVDTPWARGHLLLTPTRPLPRGEANPANLTGALPWALELANGVQCQLLTGATGTSAGMRVNYWCDGQTAVIGDIDRQRARWQVFFVPAEGPVAERVGVAVAWY